MLTSRYGTQEKLISQRDAQLTSRVRAVRRIPINTAIKPCLGLIALPHNHSQWGAWHHSQDPHG